MAIPAGSMRVKLTATSGAKNCVWNGARLGGENDAGFDARAANAEAACRTMLTHQGMNGATASVNTVKVA